ncbi:uncharacterized protein [Argopecten irradians]|uniref:uncharacterized protein n=1 Tax=Argopecten irradians TaxID=31199 RepID=UPI00371431B0
MYLDDGIGGKATEAEASDLSRSVQGDLIRFGFMIAEQKCSWVPSQEAIWLGLRWSFSEGLVFVPDSKIERLKSALRILLDNVSRDRCWVTARQLAALVGQIIAMKVAMGPVVRMMTRHMYASVMMKASWDSNVLILKEALDELRFWFYNVESLNGAQIDRSYKHDFVVYSDASATGYGGYILHVNKSEVLGEWTDTESKESSTWRELEAVRRMLLHYNGSLVGQCLVGQKVLWYTDSQNVASILVNGSKVPILNEKAVMIREDCLSRGLRLLPAWLPRADNQLADRYSKTADSDDWYIRNSVFIELNEKWGEFTVDRFANDNNAKCEVFNSRWWCPGTAGIDGLGQVWAGQNNWLVPPPALIPKVVDKMMDEKAMGTLVVPYWTSAPFWPVIAPRGDKYAFFVKEHKILPSGSVVAGKGKNGVFGRDGGPEMIALRLRF